MIRILLVDDHQLFRRSLSALLDAEEDMTVVAEAADGEEAVVLAGTMSPDVVLMDVSMPRLDGLQATRQIVRDHPDQQVVIFSSFDDHETVVGAIDAGAVGYLLKNASPDRLAAAVRGAARGESPMDPRVARTFLQLRAHGGPSLTEREREVLVLVRKGLANKQIARKLGICERTVKAHLTSAFSRIGASDRTQAALWMARRGM